MSHTLPIPENELSRILNLSEYDLDYLAVKDDFNSLASLAARITGTPMSHINLIDAFNQWTIGDYGLAGDLTPREDTVCHYTIMQDGHFEVVDLSLDERFREKGFVTGEPLLRYYYGVPLKSRGLNIGSLCVLDRESRRISSDKGELLNMIAMEVVKRIQTRKAIDVLAAKYAALQTNHKKLAHDIRGPVGGVMGLAQIIYEQGTDNTMEEVLEFSDLMQKSCNSIIDLADEILSNMSNENLTATELSLASIKDKLTELYTPQAKNKNIQYAVSVQQGVEDIVVSRNKLFQITGNLISNAIKFTPPGGTVSVALELSNFDDRPFKITVKDSGIGLSQEKIAEILNGTVTSTSGTTGEQGFGFGLNLVKLLIDELRGTFHISSVKGEGATFEVKLPLNTE